MRESTRSMAAAAAASAAATVKHEEQADTSYLDFISLPIIRLDEFDQDELRLLAQFSGHFPEASFQNLVIPKIDRRIFNESAGSRRQTYGKCFASRHWNSVPDNADDTENEEEYEPARSRGRLRKKQQRKVNVAEKTRSAKAVARVIVERKGRLRLMDTANQGFRGKPSVSNEARGQSSGGRKVSWIRRNRPSSAASDSSDDSLWTDSGRKATRATGSAKRGRPKKLVTNEGSNEDVKPNGSIDNSRKKQKQEIDNLVEEEYEEELGRRTRKRRANTNYAVGSGVVEGRGTKRRGERGAVIGRHGEIDQKDEGGRMYFGEEELMDTLTKMKGKWSSSQMKRKIVDATGFPKGWTVLVGLRHTKDGRAYFDYRDWRSPEGRIWTSYREAAAYLISTVGKDPCFKGLPHPSPLQEDACEPKTLTADGETSHEAVCSDRDQPFTNGTSLVALMDSHDGQPFVPQLFFETQTEGDLQFLERSLEQDLQTLERRVCEASIGNSHTSGDHVDKFLRVSCKADDVAISTQAFGGQVTIKTDPSTCGADGEGSRKLSGSVENLKSEDMIVSSVHCSKTKPIECQSAEEVDGSKSLRDSREDSLEQEPAGGGKSDHLNIIGADCPHHQPLDPEKGRICHLCGITFPTQIKLRRHLRRSKHLKYLRCEVCGKKFTSITLLLNHRLKMGHTCVSRENLDLTRVPAQTSNPMGVDRPADMANIVLGLLSDVHRSVQAWDSDQPSILKETSNSSTQSVRSAGISVPHMLERVKGEVEEVAPVKIPDVFECKTCHKIFHHQSKFWGHLSVHSSKKGEMVHTAPRSLKSPRSLPVPDGVYECDICHKIFHHQSKYWGHLSIHSNKRKKAPTSSPLHDLESDMLNSRMVEEPKPNVRELVSGSNGVEVNHTACSKQHVAKSVFWKLLDDSLPPEGANHEPVPCREEATIRPLAPCTKEEAGDREGNIGFQSPLDVNVGPTGFTGLPQAKSSSPVLSIHSDSLFNHGLLEQKIGEGQRIINDINEVSVGIETIWKQLSEKTPSIDVGNEACPVCRKDDDQPRHLICDWCEKEFHQGCVSPVLHEVPVDWICPFCRTRDAQTL